MPKYPGRVEEVFRALADPTRRAVVERLGHGATSTSELARPFDMAMPSFLQHLDVLERSGVVTSSKQGRVRTYRLAKEPFVPVERWIDAQRDIWERRFDQLATHLSKNRDPR